MKKNSKLSLAILIILLFIVIISATYAYFNAEIDKNGSATASITTKQLKIGFDDGPEINLNSILPGQKIIKRFSVTNAGSDVQVYHLEFIDVLNELSRKDDLVYSLTATNSGREFNEKVFPSKDVTFAANIAIGASTTQEYTMTIEYKNLSEDQSVDMNSHIHATINVSDMIKSSLPYILNDSDYTLAMSDVDGFKASIDAYNIANSFDPINWNTASVVIFKSKTATWWDYSNNIDCLTYNVYVYPTNMISTTWSENTDFSNIEINDPDKYITANNQANSYVYSLVSRTIGAQYEGWYVHRDTVHKQYFGQKILQHVSNQVFDFYYYDNYPIWISNNLMTTDGNGVTGYFIAKND